MAWVFFLIALFIWVGLRKRETAGSSHVFILVVTALTLLVVFLLPSTPK